MKLVNFRIRVQTNRPNEDSGKGRSEDWKLFIFSPTGGVSSQPKRGRTRSRLLEKRGVIPKYLGTVWRSRALDKPSMPRDLRLCNV